MATINTSAKNRNKNKNKTKTSDNVITIPAAYSPSTSLYHEKLADKLIEICHDNRIMIFGSYVREYMCYRPFNFDLSDLDLFASLPSVSLEKFKRKLQANGFYLKVLNESKTYPGTDATAFKVYHLRIGLMNDSFFINKKIDMSVDYIVYIDVADNYPPFGFLDFECNAFIWDKNGIRLSRKTGTTIDELSPRDIKFRELEIIENCKNYVTTYYPLQNTSVGSEINEHTVYLRRVRINRIIKMLERGWKINNIGPLTIIKPREGDICIICRDSIGDKAVSLSCCSSIYHPNCFISYAHSYLEAKTFIRCPQKCDDFYP